MTTSHDTIFKELIDRFFQQFMELFFPEEAKHLDFSRVKPLGQELIANFPFQHLRKVDYVAEVGRVDGETEVVLVHLEIEANDKNSLPQRMFEYYSFLRLVNKHKVLPLALVLIKNAGGLQWKRYEETLFGRTIIDFQYGQVGLADLPSDDYLHSNNAFAATLALLMKHNKKSDLWQKKFEAFRTISTSSLSDGDKLFLVNLMEVYVPTGNLSEMTKEITKMLPDIEMTWLEQQYETGKIEGKQETLLNLLTLKFGSPSPEIVARVKTVMEMTVLDQLIGQLLFITSIDQLRF